MEFTLAKGSDMASQNSSTRLVDPVVFTTLQTSNIHALAFWINVYSWFPERFYLLSWNFLIVLR